MPNLRLATPADAEALATLRGHMHTSMGDVLTDEWYALCVEAFRRLLRTTAGPINGKPPANRTGVLDIEKLLHAALPAASRLKKAPPDKDKWA